MNGSGSGGRFSGIGRSRLRGGLGTLPPRSGGSLVAPTRASSSRPMSWRARGLTATTSFQVGGTVPTVAASNERTSWAAQITTLLAWRDGRAYSVEEALATLEPRWIEVYRAGSALDADQTTAVLANLGACLEPAQLLGASGWEAMLRTFGPLALLGVEAADRFGTRGRVITSIQGDGTADGTTLGFVDVVAGANGAERLANITKAVRLVHWSIDVATAVAKREVPPPSAAAPAAPEPAVVAAPAPPPTAAPTMVPTATAPAAATWARWAPLVRAADVQSWDLPANFPSAIRDYWANPLHRSHHALWHAIRSGQSLNAQQRADATRLGLTGTPPAAGQAGAGLDFLGMHRRMMETTERLAVRGGLPYRPLGWRPIPWSHNDPVWPMPPWSQAAVAGDAATATWAKGAASTGSMRHLADGYFNDASKLVSVSLDKLGNDVESAIHGWLHMHFCTEPPADASTTDWLGDPISSHVNPLFWKLHGWVDSCIDRWERAPAEIGPAMRDSGPLLAGRWVGNVPSVAKVSGARSLEDGHDHSDISPDEAREILSRAPRMTFAATPQATDMLLAELNLGPVPQEFIAQAESPGDQPAMASLGLRRW